MARGLLAAALSLGLLVPLAPPALATAAPTTAPSAGVPASQALPAKKKSKKVKKVTLKANHRKAAVDGLVKLTGQVKPKQKAHVGFQQKFPGSKSWRGAGAKVTKKKSGEGYIPVAQRKEGTNR